MSNSAPSMKVAVLGLWHLGSVTAACVADAWPTCRPDSPRLPSLDSPNW